MSYIIPSVLVYEQLAQNNGVADVTPDLDACIIGPCKNVVLYDTSTEAALSASVGLKANKAVANLDYNTALNVYINSTKVGQVVDPGSAAMYVRNAQVQTKIGALFLTPGTNRLTPASAYGIGAVTGAMALNSNVVTMASGVAGGVYVNDYIKVVGAGSGGDDLEGYVIESDGLAGATFKLSVTAKTAVSGATVTRTGFHNLNDVTSTTLISIGDSLEFVTNLGVWKTQVLSMEFVGDKVTAVRTTDIVPGGTTAQGYSFRGRKTYADLLVPAVYNSNVNYTTTSLATAGYIGVSSTRLTSYGEVHYGEVHVQYSALRLDLGGVIQEITTTSDLLGILGTPSDQNPLALGVQIALANTTTRIKAIAVDSDDLTGYVEALELAATTRLYAIVPLTQDVSILASVQQHVEQLSTPELASWRVALVNTAIPSTVNVGPYGSNHVNTGATVTLDSGSGNYILLAANATFVVDNVVPGDIVNLKNYSPANPKNPTLTVLSVKSNQELYVSAPTNALTGVDYWVSRNLSKSQQADVVAAASTTFGSGRVMHVQPDLVGVTVDSVVKWVPGYYLACARAGLISGLPAQKGLTNIGLAGVSDLQHSNFYFTQAQLNTMAAAGTDLTVQETQGSLPYIRHSLTTDMTVLQYREIQQVKNIDFLAYFYHDILKGFPGRYNITPDTLQILRTTINAGSKLLMGKTVPKIGAPLLSYTIQTLEQDPDNLDRVIAKIPVKIPTVMNYIALYLIV